MKTTFYASILCSMAVLMLNSCAVNNAGSTKAAYGTRSSKELNKIFVRKNNGTMAYYHSLKVECGPFQTPHLLADGKVKIKAADIVAYQTNDYFAVSQSVFADGRKSYVTKNALPGFAVRVVKGSLNVYVKKYFNGLAAVDEFYIQSGDNGKIYLYSSERLQQIISDHELALSYFNDAKENADLSLKIKKTAEIYNNSDLTLN